MSAKNSDSKNVLDRPLTVDPAELPRLLDAEEIAAEKASASIDRRAWQSYLRTLEELGLAED